ncbi:MAG: phage holin family protein [Chitinophagaceae bacterium]|nr:phage holin family protein [Bacteroidota bacterium]MCC6258186.1 phage holin family protein [Chitinophagaceae bacterium]MCW5917131.1 phage holin family protein [Ferruginibacter sp.]
MNFIIRLLLNAAVAYGASLILSGVHINDYLAAIGFALVLAVLNTFIKPLLIFLTLPITVLTLGLFLFVVNAIIIIIADKLMDSIRIDSFMYALALSLVLSAFSTAINALLNEKAG